MTFERYKHSQRSLSNPRQPRCVPPSPSLAFRSIADLGPPASEIALGVDGEGVVFTQYLLHALHHLGEGSSGAHRVARLSTEVGKVLRATPRFRVVWAPSPDPDPPAQPWLDPLRNPVL